MFTVVGYIDSNFCGCKVDKKKSTSGTCHLLGCSLVSCHSKTQTYVALSTTEAEYIVARNCCAQSIWIKHQLEDCGIHLENIPLRCDSCNIPGPPDHVRLLQPNAPQPLTLLRPFILV